MDIHLFIVLPPPLFHTIIYSGFIQSPSVINYKIFPVNIQYHCMFCFSTNTTVPSSNKPFFDKCIYSFSKSRLPEASCYFLQQNRNHPLLKRSTIQIFPKIAVVPFYNNRSGLVVDQLIFSVPAVQLSDLLTNNLSRMLGSQFSHCTEMRLSARRRHIQ